MANEEQNNPTQDQDGAEDAQEQETADKPEGEEDTSSDDPGLLDFADKKKDGDAADPDPDPKKWEPPANLKLPEHLVGDSADSTIEKLGKAYMGARNQLAQRKTPAGLEGTVPDKPEGYEIAEEGEDDHIARELNSEATKPILDAFRKSAIELNIPDKTFSALMKGGLANLDAEGIIDAGLSDEEAQRISGEAELEILAEQVGAQQAKDIVNQVGSWVGKLKDRGIVQTDEEMAEAQSMFGTATAARIMQRVLVAEFGERPIPVAEGLEGSSSPAEALAEYHKALSLKPGPERDAALEAATAGMQKTFGKREAGSVPSQLF